MRQQVSQHQSLQAIQQAANLEQMEQRMTVSEATYHMAPAINTMSRDPIEQAQLASQFESEFSKQKAAQDTAHALTHESQRAMVKLGVSP